MIYTLLINQTVDGKRINTRTVRTRTRTYGVHITLTERTQRKMTHGLNYYRDAVKQGTDNNTRQMLKDYVQYIDSARNININNYIPELQINTG